MPLSSKRSALVLTEKIVRFLENLAALRTEQYAKVKRAKMLLGYGQKESILNIA